MKHLTHSSKRIIFAYRPASKLVIGSFVLIEEHSTRRMNKKRGENKARIEEILSLQNPTEKELNELAELKRENAHIKDVVYGLTG